jgi:hypothetical protein
VKVVVLDKVQVAVDRLPRIRVSVDAQGRK